MKPGLLLWLNGQLSLSFTTSPSCLFLPPRKPDPAHQGPILGPGMLCQHFPGPAWRRGGASAGSADLAKKREHPLPYTQPHTQISHWEGKVGRTLRWTAPPLPILSLSPAQAPEKLAILGGTPVVPIPIPAPQQGIRDARRQS